MSPARDSIPRVSEHPAVRALQDLVRQPTVAERDPARTDPAPFVALRAALAEHFPRLHELERVEIEPHAVLVRWPGRTDAGPVVLMAHLDVVPVEGSWTHPAFGAEIHDGMVWGRGTLDDKGAVVGICAAVEQLLERGFVPARDVWLSFGSTEEVSGSTATDAVDELRRRGVRPWLVLDEGGAVAADAFPLVRAPLAVVGVTEKGVTSVELVAEGAGGHASTPARGGPTARLAAAITALERAPLPLRAPAPTLELLRRLAPHLPAPLRPVLGRADRLAPVLTRVLRAAGAEAAAMVRTTVAVTTLSGSPALNVIASTARAGVNMRVMVGDTVDGVLDHVRRTVGPGIRVEVVERNEPSPVSPWDDGAFALLERITGELFPDAVPTPYVMMAATDARFFTGLCDRVYRFTPFRMTKDQRATIHAADERIGVADLLAGVDWYRRLVEELPA
ncbi:Peptidase M20 [Klenkia terrae]|nr:Peptidase M20 [Klenkia terrae]